MLRLSFSVKEKSQKQNGIATKSFKLYLEFQGDEISKIEPIIKYFAFPFLKSPENNENFKHLFNSNWLTSIRQQLITYLEKTFCIKNKPKLIELYENAQHQKLNKLSQH